MYVSFIKIMNVYKKSLWRSLHWQTGDIYLQGKAANPSTTLVLSPSAAIPSRLCTNWFSSTTSCLRRIHKKIIISYLWLAAEAFFFELKSELVNEQSFTQSNQFHWRNIHSLYVFSFPAWTNICSLRTTQNCSEHLWKRGFFVWHMHWSKLLCSRAQR